MGIFDCHYSLRNISKFSSRKIWLFLRKCLEGSNFPLVKLRLFLRMYAIFAYTYEYLNPFCKSFRTTIQLHATHIKLYYTLVSRIAVALVQIFLHLFLCYTFFGSIEVIFFFCCVKMFFSSKFNDVYAITIWLSYKFQELPKLYLFFSFPGKKQ